LVEKWFGDIPAGDRYQRAIPPEPGQQEVRQKEVQASVPLDALYKCWHMSSRMEQGYYAADLITEVLGGGGSSRLFQTLVKEKQLFSNIDCYHLGTVEHGLLTIEGKLVKGVSIEEADKAIQEQLDQMIQTKISDKELTKVKNKTASAIAFEDMSVMSRANSLAFYELLGDASLFHVDRDKYFALTTEDILQHSRRIFDAKNSSTLYYLSKN
jgi:predicted Zn-dependent peptidase